MARQKQKRSAATRRARVSPGQAADGQKESCHQGGIAEAGPGEQRDRIGSQTQRPSREDALRVQDQEEHVEQEAAERQKIMAQRHVPARHRVCPPSSFLRVRRHLLSAMRLFERQAE